METAGVTTKITKSNSTPTPIRKVKDQPLQRIPINEGLDGGVPKIANR